MIRIERAVDVLEAAGLFPSARKNKALTVLQDADPVPDLIARHIMAAFWLQTAFDTAEGRKEYGGDLRQLGIALSQALSATQELATVHDWLRALELTLLNIREESVEYLNWFEQAGARRWARPRKDAVAYFSERILQMDGVPSRSAVFRLLAQADPERAPKVLDALSEEHAVEITPEGLEPLLMHDDPKVRKAGLSLSGRVKDRDSVPTNPAGACPR